MDIRRRKGTEREDTASFQLLAAKGSQSPDSLTSTSRLMVNTSLPKPAVRVGNQKLSCPQTRFGLYSFTCDEGSQKKPCKKSNDKGNSAITLVYLWTQKFSIIS